MEIWVISRTQGLDHFVKRNDLRTVCIYDKYVVQIPNEIMKLVIFFFNPTQYEPSCFVPGENRFLIKIQLLLHVICIEKVVPYITMRLLLGSRIHIMQQEALCSRVRWLCGDIVPANSFHRFFWGKKQKQKLGVCYGLDAVLDDGGIKMNRTDRNLACVCVRE